MVIWKKLTTSETFLYWLKCCCTASCAQHEAMVIAVITAAEWKPYLQLGNLRYLVIMSGRHMKVEHDILRRQTRFQTSCFFTCSLNYCFFQLVLVVWTIVNYTFIVFFSKWNFFGFTHPAHYLIDSNDKICMSMYIPGQCYGKWSL